MNPLIRKNIPMPGRISRKRKYPYPDMAIGDCFFVDSHEEAQAAMQVAYRYSRKNGKKFAYRKLADDKWGIWRIE